MSDPTTTFLIETLLGWVGLSGSKTGARALTFGHSTPSQVQEVPGFHSASSQGNRFDWMVEAQELLQDFASGELVDLSLIPLDLGAGTPFQKRVRDCVRSIPCGETLSYAEVAQRSGAPGAARAVGNIMAKNPVPLLIPCHRVVGAGGHLGGYSAPQGLAMKQRLLDLERTALERAEYAPAVAGPM